MYADRDIKVVIGRIAMDSGYLSGGETITIASALNLSELYTIVFTPATSGTVTGATTQMNSVGFAYDYTNNKVVAIELSSSKEIPNGTNLSSYTTRFVAFGI
jgi:hypothetical protein